MTPESQLVQAPAQTAMETSRDELSEAPSFGFALVAAVGLALLGVPVATFLLLGAVLLAPVLVAVAVVGLARLDRSRAEAARTAAGS